MRPARCVRIRARARARACVYYYYYYYCESPETLPSLFLLSLSLSLSFFFFFDNRHGKSRASPQHLRVSTELDREPKSFARRRDGDHDENRILSLYNLSFPDTHIGETRIIGFTGRTRRAGTPTAAVYLEHVS